MKDYLNDIVQHTHSLGFIDLIKVTGTDAETNIEGLADDRSVIVQAKFKQPYAEFMGTFGMPNLNKLEHHKSRFLWFKNKQNRTEEIEETLDGQKQYLIKTAVVWYFKEQLESSGKR